MIICVWNDLNSTVEMADYDYMEGCSDQLFVIDQMFQCLFVMINLNVENR